MKMVAERISASLKDNVLLHDQEAGSKSDIQNPSNYNLLIISKLTRFYSIVERNILVNVVIAPDNIFKVPRLAYKMPVSA